MLLVVAVVAVVVVVALVALFALGILLPSSSSNNNNTVTPGCALATPAVIDSAIIRPAAQSLQLPSSSTLYIYEGSTGGHPIESLSWNADLNVTDLGTPGGPAISIGDSTSSTGSYTSTAGTYIIGGVGVSNFCSYRTVSNHAESYDSPIDVWANFTTTGSSEVLVVVGGEGVGSLELTGTTLGTLGDQTYSEEDNGVNASVAFFAGALPGASYSFEARSSMDVVTNSGSGGSLAVVVYIFPYTGVSQGSTPLGTDFAWGTPINSTGVSVPGCTSTVGHYCYAIEIAGAGGGVNTSDFFLSLRNSVGTTVAWPSGGVTVSLLSPTVESPVATYDTMTASWTLVPPYSGNLGGGFTIVLYTGATGAGQGLFGDELLAIGTNGFSGTVPSNAFA